MPRRKNATLRYDARTAAQRASLRAWFLTLAMCCVALGVRAETQDPGEGVGRFEVTADALAPGDGGLVGAGAQGPWLVAIDRAGVVYARGERGDALWQAVGQVADADRISGCLSSPSGVVVLRHGVGASELLTLDEAGGLTTKTLPAESTRGPQPTATIGGTLYRLSHQGERYTLATLDLAADASKWAWQENTALSLAAPPLDSPFTFVFNDTLYVFGIDAKGERRGYRLTTEGPAWERKWKHATAPPIPWGKDVGAAPFGEAHVFVVIGQDDEGAETLERYNAIYAYHTITDRWVRYMTPEQIAQERAFVASRAGTSVVLTDSAVVTLTPKGKPPRFAALDYAFVGVYLLGMIGIGVWFSRRENSTKDFFRGGQRVPWWASGMSLFATLSSAISLMSMPRMGYASNWTFFAIGVGELLALPIAVWFLVPLVRRLKIATSNEYLERRFGVVARVLGSVIFILMQIGGRLAPVMLLPAIALEAITGIHVIYFILVMGVITTIYTYLGGLEAVIWTDTIQGFVMVGTIITCLVLVYLKLNTPGDQVVDSLMSEDKLKTFERHWSLVYPTMWMFIIYSFTTIVMRLADQNFVQRVQCTPTLKQAKGAVITQLAVAIPLNLLLFMVGTALWLFYRDKPQLIDPTIKTDSIYPFFAAQQMPLGIAGLVVAALLAATMSTVSSSICSVSDLCVSDFYKRFKRGVNDHQALVLGRTLTAVIGVAGTATAIVLSMMSDIGVWELSILIINLISLGVAGLFLAGLLTTRVNQFGVLVGYGVAVAAVIYIRMTDQPINFFLYTFIGSVITFVVGYAASLAVPGKPRNLDGLTVYTFTDNDDEDESENPASAPGVAGTPPYSTDT